jgi:ribosome biogenesis protein UTP30
VNILRTINDIVNHIPGKWKNVKSILIKTPSSIALPIYNQLPPQNLRIKNSNQNQQENNEKTLRNKKMKK